MSIDQVLERATTAVATELDTASRCCSGRSTQVSRTRIEWRGSGNSTRSTHIRACSSTAGAWRCIEAARRPPRAGPTPRNVSLPDAPADIGDGDTGSIFWPWIGKSYRPEGVCLLPLNLNITGEPTSVAIEYQIGRHVIETFESGDWTAFGGAQFARRLLSTASAVLASVNGDEPREVPESPEEAITALERIAYVQAVKCSPRGDASKPTPTMVRECPGRYALRELEVLRPGVIVALGGEVWEAFYSLAADQAGFEWLESGRRFQRGTAELPWGTVELMWLNHPASRRTEWSEGQALLVKSLIEKPLSAA